MKGGTVFQAQISVAGDYCRRTAMDTSASTSCSEDVGHEQDSEASLLREKVKRVEECRGPDLLDRVGAGRIRDSINAPMNVTLLQREKWSGKKDRAPASQLANMTKERRHAWTWAS